MHGNEMDGSQMDGPEAIGEPDAGPTRPPNRAKRAVVAAGLAAGLLGGGAAGMILGSNGVSGAQEATAAQDSTTTTVPADGSDAAPAKPDRAQELNDALAPLVQAGTITQAQADAVVAALEDAHIGRGPGGPGGHHLGEGLATAATALGMTTDDLATALRDGQTLAEVATSKGVEPQVVIDALVAELKSHLDTRVADGDLTQAEADTRLAEGTERITTRVNEGGPLRGDGPGGRGPGAPDEAPPTTADDGSGSTGG